MLSKSVKDKIGYSANKKKVKKFWNTVNIS